MLYRVLDACFFLLIIAVLMTGFGLIAWWFLVLVFPDIPDFVLRLCTFVACMVPFVVMCRVVDDTKETVREGETVIDLFEDKLFIQQEHSYSEDLNFKAGEPVLNILVFDRDEFKQVVSDLKAKGMEL